MQLTEVSVELFEVHSTIELLRGLPKNVDAPFAFLTAKAPYNYQYLQVEKSGSVPVAGQNLVLSGLGPADKNFWRGKDSNIGYAGYVEGRKLNEVAWQKFVPFRVKIPCKTEAEVVRDTGWTLLDATTHLWSCGWAISLKLTMREEMALEELVRRMTLLKTQAVPVTLAIGQSAQPVWTLLATMSQWVRDNFIQPIIQSPLPQTTRLGPFVLISIQWSKGQPATVADLDEQSQRLIYALVSQDPSWNSYSTVKIKENFKETDLYPGSFIFMGRMGRLFSFPALRESPRKMYCYLENTKAAMMMMITLSQFVRLLMQRQTGTNLKANYPLRDLFDCAVTNLEKFPSFYKNTNLKRLARDLDISGLIADSRSRLS